MQWLIEDWSDLKSNITHMSCRVLLKKENIVKKSHDEIRIKQQRQWYDLTGTDRKAGLKKR